MRHLLAIVGQPGAGKTTALRLALSGVPRTVAEDSVPPFVVYPTGAQLGLDRPDFGGSDAYALNVQPQVIAWLRDAPFRAVVTEGDRLANSGVLQAAVDFGYGLTIAWIDTPDELAAGRRAERGSRQDAAWVRGRQTKVKRLVEHWAGYVVRIDGAPGAPDVAAELERLFVIKTLRAAAKN